MKLTTHIPALMMILSFFALIGCNNQNPQQVAQRCLNTAGCTQMVVAQCMTNPGLCQQVAANPAILQQGLTNNGVPIQLPPSTTGALPGTTIPGSPLPLATGSVRQQAQKVQQALRDASANPNSSYYVDPSAQDIPARSAISERLAAMAVNQESSQPASAPPASSSSSSADGDTVQ